MDDDRAGARRPGSHDPSYDIVERDRAPYLELVPDPVRSRITFVTAAAEDGPGDACDVELLFVDSSHERDPTLAQIAVWRPVLAPGALVVFDATGTPDYPGVAQAVAALGATSGDRASVDVPVAAGMSGSGMFEDRSRAARPTSA